MDPNTSIPSISNLLGSFDDAKSAWDMLTKRYSTTHGSMKYQLVVELHQLRQEPGQSINDYYDQLRFIWDQIDLSDPTWACSKDAQQYASIRDEFRLYEFLMSLHKDFEPIRGQLLNRSPAPSLDTAVNELVREEARLATLQAQNKLNVLAITPSTPLIEQPQQLGDFSGSSNRRKQTNKKFCNYCKRPGHTIETCYRRNKSTAAVANTAPTPPMVSTSVESQSSGSTINLSSTELQEIIAQAVRMAGNASLSTALSVLPSKSQTWLFDSACCNHMTPHSSLFSNLDPAPHPLNIHIADGSTMHGNSLGFVSTSNLSVPSLPRSEDGASLGPVLELGRLQFLLTFSCTLAFSSWSCTIFSGTTVPLSKMVEPKENFVIFLTLFVLYFFLPKFLSHFGVKLVFMLFMQINRIPSDVIHNQTPYERLFGSPLTIITFAPLDLLVSFFFSLMSTTNLSLDLDSVVSLVMAKLKRDPPQDIPPRHSTRVRSIPPHLLDYHCYTALATLHEPQTYREASTDPLWQIAMKEELDALTKNHTWDLVTLPPGQSVVGCKWIYKIKTRSDGSVECYKARLVAKGFTQEYGIDYEETFALVARISSVRALLAVAAARKWDLFQMDVKNAFLNGDLSEEVYMQPPSGLSVESNKVCHLRRALYGLKQAPRACGIQELKDFLSQQFEMKDLGHLNYFLGLEITHSTDGLYITQAKYASDLLSQAGLTDSKTVDTPVELNAHLTPSGGKPLSNPSLYRRLVSQYLSAPRSTHYAAVLLILRYLKGTLFHGLFYSAQSPLVLRAFSYADWAGDPTDRRSTTGYCFLLGSSLISWRSKKQTFVARSSTEAKYRALADTTSELLWLRWLLKDLGVSTSSATPLYCDNQSAIHIAHNDVFHERTKHIEIDCHFIRYHLVHGALKLFSISSKDQLADIFTKSLPKRRTRDLVDNLKLVSHSP
ncbi:Retrovirus-related Pol polyprotein from transposon RE2 [Vitis vinifera]|uniref:Retrovirus-related Pol polyprotein from transposon RE2 n=1 Tax=Vitis vinifera TaxID=29760 RepID=A0A438GS87_VITVI|nr:Retrovirus-related Pol polyprotein from transposon RE2 [Vitis vinifera]